MARLVRRVVSSHCTEEAAAAAADGTLRIDHTILRILLLVPCPCAWLIAVVSGLLISLPISLERRGN